MKRRHDFPLARAALLACIGLLAACSSNNIVADVVNSPLNAGGNVSGAPTALNVYLQSPDVQGIDFMDPAVVGYGIPAGGRIEVEMGEGFRRIPRRRISQKAIMVVTGTPQQGMPGKKVGYKISQGKNARTYVITPTKPGGLPAEELMSPAPGAKRDAIRQRGIKVFHIGFLAPPFRNTSGKGTIHVRIYDDDGDIVHQGSGTVAFEQRALPQILPNNFAHKQRNHNWQRVRTGDTVGVTEGTVPITFMLFEKSNLPPGRSDKFKKGILGAGVLSSRQLRAMGFAAPPALARYNGGLIVKDINRDGRLDPRKDRIIGGVIGEAPEEARGQELRSLERAGKPVLSQRATKFNGKVGRRFGGAVMQLQFTTGNMPGNYRPTLALLRNPKDLNSGDGSRYTYTIVVE